MPEPQKKTTAVEPSRGFLSRMFGSEQLSPEMQQGIEIARKENPNLAPVEPYGFFSRLVPGMKEAMGYVSPGSTIYLNPEQKGQSPQDWADTLTHEQEHVNQKKQAGVGPTMQLINQMLGRTSGQGLHYGQKPDEMGAFQAEKERRSRMNRWQSPVPSFTRPGQYYTPQDMNLPIEGSPNYKKPSVLRPTNGPVTMK